MRIRRTHGIFGGLLVALLGIWGGIIPFVGPYFNYAYTPDKAWTYTSGRLWLEILPGAGALLRLRDALRDVLASRASGAAAPDATARLTRALADGRLVVTVSPAGAAVLASSARASYSNVVAAIAIAVAQAW